MTLRDCPVHNQFRALAGHLLPLQILSTQLDRRTWSNPSSTELASRSFRVNLRLTLMSRKEAESGSLSISARPAVQSCFRTLERFPGIFGVYGGTFDEPNWFDRTPQVSRHIFLNSAQRSTVIPAGFSTFREQAILNDGTPVRRLIFSAALCVAMARAATPMRPQARKLAREATGSVRLRAKNSVALSGDGCALAGVRGPGVVNQSPADHMKNAEPEEKGRDQGLCAQSLQANERSAGWPCVNPAGDPELRDFLGYFTSGILVQKMWVAANDLDRLAAS